GGSVAVTDGADSLSQSSSVPVADDEAAAVPKAPSQDPAARQAAAQSSKGVKEISRPDHPVVLAVPSHWVQAPDLGAPILITAGEPGTGNTLGLLGFRLNMPPEKLVRKRDEADRGFMKETGPASKILHRLDTKLLGQPAYCIIAETEFQGSKLS